MLITLRAQREDFQQQLQPTPEQVLPMMAWEGGSARKGYHLSIEGIRKGYLFRLQGYERVGNFTCSSIWKSREICHSVLSKGLTDAFLLLISRHFAIYSYFETSHLQKLKEMQSSKLKSSKLKTVKGQPFFIIEGTWKEYFICQKWYSWTRFSDTRLLRTPRYGQFSLSLGRHRKK